MMAVWRSLQWLWVAKREMSLMEQLEGHKLSMSIGVVIVIIAMGKREDEDYHSVFQKTRLNLVLLIVAGSHGG